MRHNILIVDDEQLIRQGLRARIEYLGIDVDEMFEADNGLMALGIQDAHPIDLVITDICMPDMDGLELIQQMQKKNNQIQFIVLSGYAEFSYAETAIRLGVKAYLLKPVSNDDLKEAFDKVYKEMEQTASIRQEVQMKKRMDREQSAYQQEKALAQQIMTLRQEGTDSTELQQQLRTHQGFAPLLALDVDARAVATVVADWTGIPLSSLLKDEQSDLLSMEKSLENRVVGQSPALCAIAQRLRAAKTGLTPENGPQGVFLLTGPSGTGKTETALTLADTLFGGEKSLITINLSEYQEPHTVSQLKGSPPGYVGYGQGGVLTEAVRKRPYSVVLLDEVEKAHRDVMNLFYQVFDRGFMRDGEGREIDFRNTVILMTANLGSDHIMQLLEEKPDATDADLHELLYPLLRDHFQPALMARFQTVIYRPLGQEAMRAIVEMKLAQVARRLRQHYGLETEISNSLYDALTAACLLPDTGARNIDSLLNQQILPVLSQQLLAQQAVHHKPARLRLDWDDEDGIVLEFDEK